MKTHELELMMAARYRAPEFAYIPQVRSSTGYSNQIRTADALAMSLWPSRGLELHGFEMKVSRADWLKEMSDPAKAEMLAQYCDRWWVVVGDPEIVKPGELPPTWGLIVPRGGKLVTKIEAPKLNSVPITKEFLAGLLRRASEVVTPKETMDTAIAQALSRQREEIRAAEATRADRETGSHKRELESLKASVAAFEKASGVRIDTYDGERIGQAVKLVRAGQVDRLKREIDGILPNVRRIMTALEAESQALAQVTQ